MYWYKEAYKKNTKQHLHGGKRELKGAQGALGQDHYDDVFEANTSDMEYDESQIVSPRLKVF